MVKVPPKYSITDLEITHNLHGNNRANIGNAYD